MPKNKHLKFFVIIAYIALGGFFVSKILPGLISVTMPFILAACLSAISRPVMKLLKKLKLCDWLAAFFSLVVVFSAVSGILYVIFKRLVEEITQLSYQLPTLAASVPQIFEGIMYQWNNFMIDMRPEVAVYINEALVSLAQSLASLITPITQKIINFATDVVSSLPHMMVFMVVFLFSSFLFTKDYDKIKKFIKTQLPESAVGQFMKIKSASIDAVVKYLRSMGIILLITFTELFVGFSIIGVPYTFIFALIIAVLDVLPAIGTGGILVPWAIIWLIAGNIKGAVSIIVLYLIITIIRQFIEPKIMSSSFGTYPLVTLVSMYIGLRLFGVTGLILLPIFATILIYMQRAGVFKLWKTEEGKTTEDGEL